MLRWLEPIDPERSWPWLQSFLTDKHTKIRDAGKSIDLKGICYLFSFFFWGGMYEGILCTMCRGRFLPVNAIHFVNS